MPDGETEAMLLDTNLVKNSKFGEYNMCTTCQVKMPSSEMLFQFKFHLRLNYVCHVSLIRFKLTNLDVARPCNLSEAGVNYVATDSVKYSWSCLLSHPHRSFVSSDPTDLAIGLT